MTAVDPADIAVMRAEGDLVEFLMSLTGKAPAKPKPTPVEDDTPAYHIARPGAWPCGTAPTGPSPGPHCPDCRPNGDHQ